MTTQDIQSAKTISENILLAINDLEKGEPVVGLFDQFTGQEPQAPSTEGVQQWINQFSEFIK